MEPQAIIEAVQNLTGGMEELYRCLVEAIPQLDPAGQDALWAALKKKTDELYRADLNQALAMAHWMIDLPDQTGNPLHRALGLIALGNIYAVSMGEHRKAVDCYNEAAAIYKEHHQPVGEAQSQIGKIFALANLGRYEEALRDGEWAGQVLAEHGEKLLEARVVMNLAILRGRLGQDAEALSQFDYVAQIYEAMGESAEQGRARVEVNRALVLRNLGRFDESIQASQRALDYFSRSGRRFDAALSQQSLAMTCFIQGRYNESLALLETVREAFLRDGRRRYVMLVELFVSDCLLQLRRFPEVLEKCRQVRDLFDALGCRFEVGQAIVNEAVAYEGMGRYSDAQASLDEARLLFEQEGNQSAVADCDLEMARLLIAQGQLEAGHALAASCEQVFERLEQPTHRARACLVGARALLAMGQAGAAEDSARRALSAGEKLFLPDLTYPSYHLLGQVAIHQGCPEGGLEVFEQAINDLEQLCGRLMVEFRAGFVEDKGAVYEDAIALCLDLNQPDRGLAFCERSKSRALLDLLSQRVDLSITARSEADQPLVEELQDLRAERDRLYRRRQGGEGFGQRGDDGALSPSASEAQQVLALEKRITDLWHRLLVRSADYARQASLWQVRTEPVQPYLHPGSLLVEYYAVHGRLVAFLVDAEKVEAVQLPGDLDGVQRLMQNFWHNLRTVATMPEVNRPGLAANMKGILARFYALLIQPFAGRLEQVERLVIVPHGPLHYLPFHALHDGQGYLLERCEVSILPGASLLRYCREAASSYKANVPTSLLAVGHSYGGRLPNVLTEAREVAEMWQSSALMEESATLEAVREAAPGCRVLHLATHGDFRPDNPLFSGLALADGWLTTLDVFNLRLNTSLVTLSACQTGRSVVGGGDELLGLMRSFLAAGTASLVATLWAVEDRSTAELMRAFYEALAAGAEKGTALRQAQLKLLREPPEGRSHPYFWAPFYLVGDDGAL